MNQIHLHVPALRERREDIIPLANFFLHGTYPHLTICEEAKATLESYHWPGNIRELRNVVLTAAVFCPSETITAHELPAHIQQFRPRLETSEVPVAAPLETMEKDLILRALRGTAGHQQKAARILGISRRTLSRKLRSYSLHKG